MKKDQGQETAHRELFRLLKVSDRRAFKIWVLSPGLKIAGWALGIASAAVFLWLCWHWATTSLITLGALGNTAVVVGLGFIVGKRFMKSSVFERP